MRRKITPSLLISLLALFVALGGTGYAITKLPKNSVGTKQIKKNAVNSAKVKNRSLAAKDFKSGQLPKGAKGSTGSAGPAGISGPTGATGAIGSAGSALAYGYIQDVGPNPEDLTIVPEKSKGIDTSMVSSPSTGVYCFQLESIWPVHVVAATAEPQFGDPSENDKYAVAQVLHNTDFGLCPDNSDMVVVTRDQSANAAVDWFFYVTLN